jgi:hypothetical protein
MAELLLGPLLRHVDDEAATIWVETDAPCTVAVLGEEEPTFEVEGHHYALVAVEHLAPGESTDYTVEIDGEQVWPPSDYPYPTPCIKPVASGEGVRFIFGSCRVSFPHEEPYVLHQTKHPQGQGIDALRTLALRLIREEERTPDCLLMLGDQIYADDLSPAMREVTGGRTEHTDAPEDQLADYREYALAYREAWSEPLVRWLLSTVPVAMIFDDHEVHAQWKISRAWQDMLTSQSWYERRVDSALMTYWVYQHLGNLSCRELANSELYERVRSADGDAGPILAEQMRKADEQPGHSRWSYYRDLGDTRLLVIDSRAGRELEPPDRRMISSGEWDWIVDHAAGNFDHLLVASSLPFFLTPGLHYIEAWDAQLADRGRTGATRKLGEKIRQKSVMDHWASFQDSFRELCGLLEEIASGAHGDGSAPETIIMLSGDVHHCYLAEVPQPRLASGLLRLPQGPGGAREARDARRKLPRRGSRRPLSRTRGRRQALTARLAHRPRPELRQPGRQPRAASRRGPDPGRDDRRLGLARPRPPHGVQAGSARASVTSSQTLAAQPVDGYGLHIHDPQERDICQSPRRT